MKEITSIGMRTLSLLGERVSFGQALGELVAANDKVIVITADQTNAALYNFQKKHPDKLINVGISEQNAITVAAGLANEGYVPFVMFQAAFASMRCADQVRVCMSYMKRNIKLVGIFSGFTFSDCGPTHYALSDIALYRTFPNMAVVAPADATEVVKATHAAAFYDGPVYIRIGGSVNTPMVYRADYHFKIGEAVQVKDGRDICMFATGTMVYRALKVARCVENDTGLTVRVVNMHTLKPIDSQCIKNNLSFKLVVSLEEHSTYGGLGGAIAEEMSLLRDRPPHMIVGARDMHVHAAEYEYLLGQHGLSVEDIANRIKNQISDN